MTKKIAVFLAFMFLLAVTWSLAQENPATPTPGEGEAKPAEAKPAEDEAKPAEGEQPKPAEGEQPKPAEGEQPKPAEGEQPKPAEGEQPKPAEGEQPKPAEGEQPKPAEGEQPKPAEGEQPKPAEGEQPKPAEGEQPKPAVGEQPKPAEGEQPKPAEGEQPKPAEGEQPKPAEGEQPKPGPVEIPQEVAKLLLGLKSTKAEEREASAKALASMGGAFIEVLKAAAAAEADQPVRERIISVIEIIEDGDAVKFADGAYSLDVREWQSSRLLKAFFRHGNRIIAFNLERDSVVTMKVDGLAFFQALDAILAETGCYLWGAEQSMGPGVRSLPERFVKKYSPIASYGNDSRFQVLGVSRKRSFYPAQAGSVALNGWLTVVPGTRIEPQRRFGGAAEAEYSAIDDTGADLSGGLAVVRERGPGSFYVSLELKEPAPEAKKIAKLSLSVKTAVFGKSERIAVEGFRSKAGGNPVDSGSGVVFNVVSIGEKDMKFSASGRGNPRLGSMGTLASAGGCPEELHFTGADGGIIKASSHTLRMDGEKVEYELTFDAPLPESLTLVYTARSERREESLSFEVAGVPLFDAVE